MAVKNHKLVEKEVELKWLASRVTILEQKALESKLVKEEISSQIVSYFERHIWKQLALIVLFTSSYFILNFLSRLLFAQLGNITS